MTEQNESKAAVTGREWGAGAAFGERLRGALAYARRTRCPVSLILLDTDAPAVSGPEPESPDGSETLRQVAALLRAGVREEDVVARVGARGFAVLLPGARLAEAGRVAERVQVLAASHPSLRGGVRVGAGFAEFGGEGDDADALWNRAETALASSRSKRGDVPLRRAA